ncbi:MAG: hypothetical protein ACLFR8_01480 [Alkalispirochaeta sp.]
MKHTQQIISVLVLALIFVVPVTAQEEDSESPAGVDGTVAIRNVSIQGWRIVSVGGDGVRKGGADATVYLEVGGRYHFDLSEIDSERFPVDFRGPRGEVLFSQNGETELAVDGVDLETDDDGVQFTLTPDLADRLAFFRAAPYPQMVGIVAPYTVDDDADQAEETDTRDETDGDDDAEEDG